MLTTLATEEKAKPGNDYTQSQPIFNQKWLEKCYTMYYWEIQPNQIWLKQLIPIKRTQNNGHPEFSYLATLINSQWLVAAFYQVGFLIVLWFLLLL